MTLLTSEPPELKFLARFEHVWAALRRYQVRQGLCLSLLAAALGLAVLVVADFVLELSWTARAAGLGIAGIVALAVFIKRVVGPLRWWTRPRTAVEIETRFPELGQRIRTVVQYAGLSDELIDSEGVMPSLVDALEEETEVQSKPLPLDSIIPWRRLWGAAAVAVAPIVVLAVLALSGVEWRIALERALLAERPYTTLSVAPGNLLVDQDNNVPLTIELKGRVNRKVVLYTRPEGKTDAPWKAIELDPADKSSVARRETKLEKIHGPIAYRVVAGPASSPTYRVDVRYPLAITAFDVALKPPAYTAVPPSTVKGGNLQVIEGTAAAFKIAFDAPSVESPVLVMTDPSVRAKTKKGEKEPEPQVVPLKADGKALTAEMTFTKGLVYKIQARTADGRILPKNSYKVDVHEDRPPRVAFESPDEALEVHPIAEILNRVRVGDDFGLSKAGIVFQFNNGDEQTLVAKSFDPKSGKPQTSGSLEEMLLLEKLAATPTDSLSYYAFAEDNYPAGAKRTETDLRYLDIRPFKREYKKGESGEEAGEQSVSLAELIARQRFNLNRATRLAKHKPTDRIPAEDPLKISGFEETLVAMTREFTEGVEGVVGQRVEPLHQAEEAMLAAVAALDRGRNGEAPPNMSEALRRLIEVRNTLRQLIADDPALAQAMRSFDRAQAQKIRKQKKEEEDPEELAYDLEKLAEEEDFVYKTLAAGAPGGQEAKAEKGEKGEEAEKSDKDAEKGEKEAEPKDAQAKDSQKGDRGEKGQDGQKGQEGEKGQDGQKGQKGQKGSKGQGEGQGQGDGQGQGQDGKGENEDKDGSGDAKDKARREAAERQEKIATRAREIEDKLKKVEDISDLAKARMAKAAEATEKASSALARGNTKEATETAKSGAAMLHELARQVKGEVAKEVAAELAMARDLADELAEREAELAQMPDPGSSGSQGQPNDQEGSQGKGEKGEKGQKGSRGSNPGQGQGGQGGVGDLTDEERLDRIEEAARTLEEWLRGASARAEGRAAEQIRELIEQSNATEIVERTERVGTLYLGGQKPDARREATELSRKLEVIARQLDVLHRGIVAPELAALVEYDKRVAELTAKLKTLKTDAEITEWHRLAAALIRDLEKAGLNDAAAALTKELEAGGWRNAVGAWNWAYGADAYAIAPVGYPTVLHNVGTAIQDKIQDLILKDLKSARDEATPPEFKELVDRYYEVLSKDNGTK